MATLTEKLCALGNIREARNELERAQQSFTTKHYNLLVNKLDEERKALLADLPQCPKEKGK